MPSNLVWGGILLLAVGSVHAVWPLKMARRSERYAKFGAEPSAYGRGPDDRRVRLTRIAGVGLVVLGAITLAVAFLG